MVLLYLAGAGLAALVVLRSRAPYAEAESAGEDVAVPDLALLAVPVSPAADGAANGTGKTPHANGSGKTIATDLATDIATDIAPDSAKAVSAS